MRLAVRQLAPVRRDAHSVHIRQLRQRQRDAVVSERQVDARQARILCAQVDLRAAARHLERLERRSLRDGRREQRLVGPCEQRLQQRADTVFGLHRAVERQTLFLRADGVAAARGVGIAEKIELVAVFVHFLRVLGRAGAEKRKQED